MALTGDTAINTNYKDYRYSCFYFDIQKTELPRFIAL
jgi:hypothetical protein